MLCLPDSGFQRSVTKHNGRLDVLVEWIEGSVTFIDEELSRTDVVDMLCENGIYGEQDFANERVADAWIELDRRSKCVLEGSPFDVVGRRISRRRDWSENLPYSFCLMLSMTSLFKRWAKQFGTDFTEQGAMFEELTAECLECLGWTVHRTGWSPAEPSRIREVVRGVSEHLGEAEIPGELAKWIPEAAKEDGLDVVCSDPFNDGWGGRPLYFFQCASGADWEGKLHTPDPDAWQRVISFTNVPKRGFAMPFALLEDKFRRSAGRVNGMFLDRFRLQSPSAEGDVDWVSPPLVARIRQWMKPRVKQLPDDRQ